MTFVLAILWFALFAWLLVKWPVSKSLGIRNWAILGLFLCKVLAGVAYGWFFMQMDNYRTNADTWAMFFDSLVETDWLKQDPVAFFRDLFTPRYQNDSGLLGTENSLLNDLREVLFIKFIAIVNLLTGGRYYVNVVVVNGLYTFGLLGLAKAFQLQFGKHAAWAPFVALLFPTVLFWSSGVHKDGLLLSLSSMLLLAAVLLKKQQFNLKLIWFVLPALAIFFLLRPHACLLFILSCTLLWLPSRLHASKRWSAILIGAVLIVAAFLYYLNPAMPASWLAERRSEFIALSATDVVSTKLFQGDFRGLLSFLPLAIAYGLCWPLPGMYTNPLAILAGIENFVVLLLWLSGIYSLVRYRSHIASRKFILVCFAYFICTALLVGITIPYLSPLMRYKSIALPFIIGPSLVLLQPRIVLLQQIAIAMFKK